MMSASRAAAVDEVHERLDCVPAVCDLAMGVAFVVWGKRSYPTPLNSVHIQEHSGTMM